MAKDPYRYFRVEARELLEGLNKGMLELERQGSSAEVVARLLRLAHTLKGAARVVKQREIGDLAHALEGVLAPHRDGTPVPRERIDSALGIVDSIAAEVAQLGAPPAPKDAAAPKPRESPPAATVRTDSADVEALLVSVRQAQAELGAMRRGLEAADRAKTIAVALLDRLEASAGSRPDEQARLVEMAHELRATTAATSDALGGAVGRVRRELAEVRERAERLRLVPASSVFPALERMVRDVARALRKQARFVGRGDDVRLEADAVSILHGALVQLVRNAVAHGIESASERAAAGKPAEGLVEIEVHCHGNRVAFACRDDGRGIDVDAVRHAARAAGIELDERAAGKPDDLLGLLTRSGFSTSAAVDDVSGRGVGLDVVRDAAERLGGEISVETKAGAGTTFTIGIPLVRAAFAGLVVAAGGQQVVVPAYSIERTIRLPVEAITRAGSAQSAVVDGTALPFAPLGTLLSRGRAPEMERRTWTAMIVSRGGTRAVLGVDGLVSTETVVSRSLPPGTPVDAIVAGVCLDDDGEPFLALDPDQLVAAARRGVAPHAASTGPSKLPILVVDDSLTTRMLEQSILESAGYEVDTAKSGEEGLEMARQRRYALFLVDVEMPGMDGFTFVRTTRADAALRDVPVILVTSRSSPEDRALGQRVGASDYVVKSEFDQALLLDRIRVLTGAAS